MDPKLDEKSIGDMPLIVMPLNNWSMANVFFVIVFPDHE